METTMNNRAVIYVRTSSEHQGEKSSPVEQEADCRQLAAEKGLMVVNVYRDIEKYRVRSKLFEPSGTRSDRPGLLAMLKDAARGEFDIILAWREDRLYRGMRSMLLVLENIQEHKITVLLARETFDPKIAPLRAWVAQMELDGMKERMTMGVKARLRAGKANTGQDRYGYQRIGDRIVVVDEEAKWVRQIFEWYLEGAHLMDIRERLIVANAPQKGSSIPRRIQWARSSIQAVLIAAKEYAYGIKIQSRQGEKFEIPIDPIIDVATYERFAQVRAKNKTYPARRLDYDYLIGGVLYCACNHKWGARTQKSRKNRRGELVARKTITGIYFCHQTHKDLISPECPRHIGAKKADAQAWQKICEAVDKPQYLLAQARKLVEQLRASADTLHEDQARLENEIEALTTERQWLITQARKGSITTADMEYQLGAMTLQEVSLKRELSSLGQAININTLNDWEAKINEYLADLRAGIEALKNAAPQDEEERHNLFLLKKQIVDTLVERITITKDRVLKVEIRLNLLGILEEESGSDDPSAAYSKRGGTCTRTPTSRARRRPGAVCASPSRPASRSPVSTRPGRSTGR
jgi:DNA invertase Pin-like site-specific DNA recombinase